MLDVFMALSPIQFYRKYSFAYAWSIGVSKNFIGHRRIQPSLP